MNILSKLSIRNLKLNKKRTISTIIGIILSVALICAVSSMGVSFQATLVENATNETGYWHIQLINIEDNQIKDIENNRDVKDIFQTKRRGYAKLKESQNEYKPYVRLISMNNNTFKNLNLKLLDGKFPANSNEVLISKTLITDAKVNYKIGDTINLDIGERKTLDDYILDGNNMYNAGEEKIINTVNYSFKIVGIIERPDTSFEEYGDPGYTIISTGINQGENDLYVSLKKPQNYKTSLTELLGVSDYKTVRKHDTKLTKYDYNINEELLRWEAFAFSDSTVNMLYSVIGVVIFVIIITSIFCIRNSFAIATTEKVKMYSMLASVGTTKKQIKKNVITEGLILGLVGIPLGIISGFFAVFVLLKIVNIILKDYLFDNVDGLVFKISIIPIILSVILGFLTIYLSARSSAKKASKIMPIEGLRSSNEIKIKSKKLKVPKIITKIFKIGGDLAYKNLKRSKKKYRTTVISISVSIFIFITMNAFISNMLDVTNDYYKDYNYNIQISTSGLTNEELEKILSQENINQYTTLYSAKEDQLKIEDLNKINQLESDILSVDKDNNKKYSSIKIMALDSKTFEKYAKQIGVKYDEVKGKSILCDEYNYYDSKNEKTIVTRKYTYEKGDIIKGKYEDRELSLEVGAISKIKPDGIERSYSEGGYLIVELEQYKDIDFSVYQITIQSDNCTQLEKDLKKLDYSMHIYNLEAAAKEERAMVLVTKIFLYGFITVITLIGVTNIFNTITSNMELRQKEFAMLKSIGMTKKEFNRMINLETIFYGTKSWIYGTIMGLLGTFAMYKAFSVKIEQGVYIPINAIIISAIFVFIFVFIIMKYSIAKINKQNTIETIRKENI